LGALERPDLSNVRTIGCTAYYHLQKEKRCRGSKFEDRAKKGILVGFEGNSIYRIYDPTVPGNIVRASAVTFDESTVPALNLDDFEDDVTIHIDDPIVDLVIPAPKPHEDSSLLVSKSELDMDDFQSFIDDQDDSDDDLFNPKLLIPRQNITPRSHQEHRRNPLPTLSKPQNKPATIPTAASSRPSRTTEAKTPKLQAKGSLERNYHLAHDPFKNSTQAFISQSIHIFAAALTRDPAEPLTYQAAMNSPDSDKWMQAMHEEYENLISKNT
jgi:hypothetical protein